MKFPGAYASEYSDVTLLVHRKINVPSETYQNGTASVHEGYPSIKLSNT